MDEAGIMEGEGSNGMVIGYADDNFAPIKSPDSRIWTSILESISAAGTGIPPLVIFKGLTVQHQWFPIDLSKYEGWRFIASQRSWNSNTIALEWLLKIFIPLIKPETPY